MLVQLKKQRTQQPKDPVGIDWSNPLTRDLAAVILPFRDTTTRVGTATYTTKHFNRFGSVVAIVGTGSSLIYKSTRPFGSNLTIAHVGNAPIAPSTTSAYCCAIGNNTGGNQSFGLRQGNTSSQGLDVVVRPVNGGAFTSVLFQNNANGFPDFDVYMATYAGSDTSVKAYRSGKDATGSINTNGNVSGAFTACDNYALSGQKRGTDTYSTVDFIGALGCAWYRTLNAIEAAEFARNPWQIFNPTPRRVFYSLPATVAPTLSAAGVTSITTTGATPRVTLTF